MTSDPIGLMGGLNTFGYVGGNPVIYIDRYGLATEQEISIALEIIYEKFPELYTIKPNSVTPVQDLTTWYGKPIQGVTSMFDNIEIRANVYGNECTPVSDLLYQEFLQTIAHESLHVQQKIKERILTIGELHQQIDKNAEIVAKSVLDEFTARVNKLGKQTPCECR